MNMDLDIDIQDGRWRGLELDALANRALGAALHHLGLDADRCEIGLLACDDARMAGLNAGFRSKEGATNVLSWPSVERAATEPGCRPHPPQADFTGVIALGDIAIAWETCMREARTAGISPVDHTTHLLVHGALHLLGYDHVCDPDAALMQKIETEILGKLGVDDPYNDAIGP